MDPQNQVAVFFAEFDYQVDQIAKIYSRLKSKMQPIEKKPVSADTVESAGYWLHNLYGAYEDLFKRVAGFWENNVSTDGEYHIHLLRRMLLKIKGIRPSLVSENSYPLLNEQRGFRHVFRHAYSYGLDGEWVAYLLRKIIDTQRTIFKDLEKFRSLISRLDKPHEPL